MINVACEYTELIAEIEDEIAQGNFSYNDSIQIIRSSYPENRHYYPIVDWRYNDACYKEENFGHHLYLEEKPYLVSIAVSECLSEMKSLVSLVCDKTA